MDCNLAKTFDYLKGKPKSPKEEKWKMALENWKKLYSDEGCNFDKEININAKEIEPLVTWGTSPQDVSPISGIVPDPEKEKDKDKKGLSLHLLQTTTLARLQNIDN